MPTYEYECKSCGYNFEAFQSMSEPPLSDCPKCGKEVRRLINGGAGIIFKGSGFYITDKNSGTSKIPGKETKAEKSSVNPGESNAACKSCPASAASGGACPASEKAAG